MQRLQNSFKHRVQDSISEPQDIECYLSFISIIHSSLFHIAVITISLAIMTLYERSRVVVIAMFQCNTINSLCWFFYPADSPSHVTAISPSLYKTSSPFNHLLTYNAHRTFSFNLLTRCLGDLHSMYSNPAF